jgi:hypothetical protein
MQLVVHHVGGILKQIQRWFREALSLATPRRDSMDALVDYKKSNNL